MEIINLGNLLGGMGISPLEDPICIELGGCRPTGPGCGPIRPCLCIGLHIGCDPHGPPPPPR